MSDQAVLKIGIVGLGVVGSACRFGFEKLGHDVIVHDIKFDTALSDIVETEVAYICVPTPSGKTGICDSAIVEEVIQELDTLDYQGIIAIKSTVLPGTTENLLKKYERKICFVPEFLRERCAISDFVENHTLLAIGTNDKDVYNIIKQCHGPYPQEILQVAPGEAEMLKYYSNIFNALRITFSNEIYEVCHRLGINYANVKNAYVKMGSVPDIYLDVNKNFRGYGGVCLPKDVWAMSCLIEDLGLDFQLIKTIHNENKKYKVTVFDGMRKS